MNLGNAHPADENTLENTLIGGPSSSAVPRLGRSSGWAFPKFEPRPQGRDILETRVEGVFKNRTNTYCLFVVFTSTVFDGAKQGEKERKKERRGKRDIPWTFGIFLSSNLE